MGKQRLELTWIGKNTRPKLEPRILIEDPEKSYGSTDTDNMLIHGDNLLALKALEQEYAGRIKCVFIDPPYNTGNAFEHYEDGLEHSIWLSLMQPRIELIHKLLSDDGTLWISIDDNEGHYLKVLCDEIFGRNCFVSTVIWRSTDNSNNDAKQFSVDHNMILVYSKKADWLSNRLDPPADKRKHFKNPDNDPNGPWFDGNPISSPNPRPNLVYDIEAPNGNLIKAPRYGWRWSRQTLKEKMDSGEIRFNGDFTNIKRRTYLKDMKGLPPSTLWSDLDETGHNRQAKYEQKKLFPDRNKEDWFSTPKPEKLIQRILEISTVPGDLCLDSFLGSGTTSAVAQKMGRKWIGIELGEHCFTHCKPRIDMIIRGEDDGGITEIVDWNGGGGYKYYELAPSLLNKDTYGNWIINQEYNADMLAAAMAKQEGFKYNPDPDIYWKQGQSTEQDFIFTTTEFLTQEHVEFIHSQMQEGESLLICCKAFNANDSHFHNITIKKIPKMLMGKCEFGKDDYSLNIINIPIDDNDEEFPDSVSEPKPKYVAGQAELFDMEGDNE